MTDLSDDILPEDGTFMELALAEARRGFEQGGIPVGAVLARDGELLEKGHNQRVQKGSAILHGEMDCLERYGRQRNYEGVTLYTTLSPCMMCAGTAVQFRIPRIVIGQRAVHIPGYPSFEGNVAFLENQGIDVTILDHRGCEALFKKFIESNLELWLEDIGESPRPN